MSYVRSDVATAGRDARSRHSGEALVRAASSQLAPVDLF